MERDHLGPTVILADYGDAVHASAITDLLDAYARDPMGGGKALPTERLNRLVGELAKRSHAFSVLAFVDDQPAGLANCFELFSTFACQPLINVHDLAVTKAYRGRGIGRALLRKVEQTAAERGCCKLTLEVLEGNQRAKSLYKSFGFEPYELEAGTGQAMFWQKPLQREEGAKEES